MFIPNSQNNSIITRRSSNIATNSKNININDGSSGSDIMMTNNDSIISGSLSGRGS